jgi:hypothetical protein
MPHSFTNASIINSDGKPLCTSCLSPDPSSSCSADGPSDELTQTLKEMRLKMDKMGDGVDSLNDAMPNFQIPPPLTPSQASGMKDEYDKFLKKLSLNTKPIDKKVPTASAANSTPATWKWGWNNQEESKSYTPLQAHITELLLDRKFGCEIVGNGQRLSGGLLFEEACHSLRVDPSKRFQPVRYIRTIRGRTDLVVLDQEVSGIIGASDVRLAVEVKTQEAMDKSTDECEREAIIQLIGINANNAYRNPPVLLTNLLRTHKVYHLERVSENPLRFEVWRYSFHSLDAAVLFAVDNFGGYGVTSSIDFARPATPILEEP